MTNNNSLTSILKGDCALHKDIKLFIGFVHFGHPRSGVGHFVFLFHKSYLRLAWYYTTAVTLPEGN